MYAGKFDVLKRQPTNREKIIQLQHKIENLDILLNVYAGIVVHQQEPPTNMVSFYKVFNLLRNYNVWTDYPNVIQNQHTFINILDRHLHNLKYDIHNFLASNTPR